MEKIMKDIKKLEVEKLCEVANPTKCDEFLAQVLVFDSFFIGNYIIATYHIILTFLYLNVQIYKQIRVPPKPKMALEKLLLQWRKYKGYCCVDRIWVEFQSHW